MVSESDNTFMASGSSSQSRIFFCLWKTEKEFLLGLKKQRNKQQQQKNLQRYMTRKAMYQKQHDFPSPFPNFHNFSDYISLSMQSL